MDPFRVGIAFVAIAGGVMIISAALPTLVQTLLDLIPSVLILVFIFWTIKALIEKLLS